MQIACQFRSDNAFQRVRTVLGQAGYDTVRFQNETALLRGLRRDDFALILVETDELGSEDAGIYSWLNCRTGESTPVVLLTSVDNPHDIARALNAGADACIEPGCEPVELVARLHALMRRAKKTVTRRTIAVNGFTLDQEAGILFDHGMPVSLTPREFTMAWLFFSAPGIYMSRDTIAKAIWGVDSEIASRTIEQHVYKLRKKLGLTSARGAVIRTTYTRGYCLQLTEVTEEEGQQATFRQAEEEAAEELMLAA